MNDKQFCCEVAKKTGSSLAGSAVQVDVWLAIEYAYAWKARALEENILPALVKQEIDRLTGQFADIGLSLRVQFIKQAATELHAPRLYFADGRDGHWSLQSLQMQGYEAFPAMNASALLAKTDNRFTVSTEGMYLVCTNGQRDLCCARFGRPLYSRLYEVFGNQVWQTSHVGGHRYAPNLLCLPSGFMYGNVSPDIGVTVVQDHEAGQVAVDLLRGRSHYSPLVQAGEIFARREHGLTRQDALTCAQGLEDESAVCYQGEFSGEIILTQRPMPNLPSDCEPNPKPSVIFTRVD